MREGGLAVGGQVLDDDKRNAGIHRHVFKESLEGLKTACRGAKGRDWKVGLGGFLRVFSVGHAGSFRRWHYDVKRSISKNCTIAIIQTEQQLRLTHIFQW